jgi:hypothetical protein
MAQGAGMEQGGGNRVRRQGWNMGLGSNKGLGWNDQGREWN